jgi:hypothetical protein
MSLLTCASLVIKQPPPRLPGVRACQPLYARLKLHRCSCRQCTGVIVAEQLAHLPWAFRALLAFAGAAGSRLGARRLLGWLTDAVGRVQDLESLWRDDDTSRLTAQALDRLWKREEQEIRRDREALAQYVSLLDKLKRAGEPLAARLLAGVQL